MPYIKEEDYERAEREPENSGELNFCLTTIVQDYLKRVGKRYQNMNDIIGALEGCKIEFYRRVVAPYEDTKIKENGDVYQERTKE